MSLLEILIINVIRLSIDLRVVANQTLGSVLIDEIVKLFFH